MKRSINDSTSQTQGMNPSWRILLSMRRNRLVASCVCSFVALLFTPAGNAQIAPPPSPAGDKAIVISGSHSGWARFTLRKSVHVDGLMNFAGNGRMVAFALVPDPVPTKWTSGTFLYGVSFGRCSSPGCKADRGRGWFYFGSSRLPRGHYRLYLIADGARARVELPLQGLSRTIHLRAEHEANVRIRTLTPRVSNTPGQTVLSAGDSSKLTGGGLAFQGLWLDTSATAAASWGDCVYRQDEEVPDETVAYLPGPCSPPGIEDTVDTFGAVDGLRLTSSAARPYLPKAMGAWYATASMVKDAGAVAVWLKF